MIISQYEYFIYFIDVINNAITYNQLERAHAVESIGNLHYKLCDAPVDNKSVLVNTNTERHKQNETDLTLPAELQRTHKAGQLPPEAFCIHSAVNQPMRNDAQLNACIVSQLQIEDIVKLNESTIIRSELAASSVISQNNTEVSPRASIKTWTDEMAEIGWNRLIESECDFIDASEEARKVYYDSGKSVM